MSSYHPTVVTIELKFGTHVCVKNCTFLLSFEFYLMTKKLQSLKFERVEKCFHFVLQFLNNNNNNKIIILQPKPVFNKIDNHAVYSIRDVTTD